MFTAIFRLQVDDEILAEMAQYRQNRRLPVLTYMHPSTKASLMVAGQPLAGDKKRCYEDERMFRSILQCSSDAKEVRHFPAQFPPF